MKLCQEKEKIKQKGKKERTEWGSERMRKGGKEGRHYEYMDDRRLKIKNNWIVVLILSYPLINQSVIN